MFINPETLIDQTIENLQLISELLADDLDRLTHPFVSTGSVQSSNAIRTIDSLVPQLQGARQKLRSTYAVPDAQGLPPQRMCANCDDF
jgi:hypothetical protein